MVNQSLKIPSLQTLDCNNLHKKSLKRKVKVEELLSF
jgi:hypothetical protein